MHSGCVGAILTESLLTPWYISDTQTKTAILNKQQFVLAQWNQARSVTFAMDTQDKEYVMNQECVMNQI